MVEFLINFFNLKIKARYNYADKKDKKFTNCNKRFLLVLDNCQSVIDKELQNFKKLLF